MPADRTILPIPVFVTVLVVCFGCSPSLYPLYRDYEVTTEDEPVRTLLRESLEEVGWTLVPGHAPNVLATDVRRLQQWGLYQVVVSLEAAPVGGQYVRVFVHPYREYVTGHRSKIPYLKGSIRRSVLRDLDVALESRGLLAVGTGISRDRKHTAQ